MLPEPVRPKVAVYSADIVPTSTVCSMLVRSGFESKPFPTLSPGEWRGWRPDCLVLCAKTATAGHLVGTARGRLSAPILVLTPVWLAGAANGLFARGADDVVRWPCHPIELEWRVRNLLRRYAPPAALPVLSAGGMRLDAAQGVVFLPRRKVRLTPRETAVLALLMRRPGVVRSRTEFIDACWPGEVPGPREVDYVVFSLRRKLGPRWGARLATRTGFGYYLDALG